MADEVKIDPAAEGEADEPVEEIEIDDEEGSDLDAMMRDALAAVEHVESRAEGEEDDNRAGGEVAAEEVAEAEELDQLRREIDELRDRSVRTLADFDNYRKRSERERGELRRYALLEPMREMLAVVDNLERAVGAEGSADDLRTGVEMILHQMHDLLRRQGVREVPAEGELFDPSVHDAVSRREEPGLDEPRVVRELQRGYLLHDRLLRPATVEVAVPADETAGDNEG